MQCRLGLAMEIAGLAAFGGKCCGNRAIHHGLRYTDQSPEWGRSIPVSRGIFRC